VFSLRFSKSDRLAEKIWHLLSQPFDLAGGHSLSIFSSISVAIYPEYGTDEMQLLKNADGAMYRAKQCGRNKIQLCQSAHN
jgi:diguanylate cyclase (GGDEF)-like protein